MAGGVKYDEWNDNVLWWNSRGSNRGIIIAGVVQNFCKTETEKEKIN